MSTFALTNAQVLTDNGFQSGIAVLVENGRIAALLPESELPNDVQRHDLHGDYLLPGFIDIQVNGGGGVLFNNTPTVEDLRTLVAGHRKFGSTGLLPTLISDDIEVMRAAVAAVRQAIAEGVPGVLGIHLEGP